MHPGFRCLPLLLVALTTAGTGSAARGDDWLQFRHNPGRTGVSKDRTRLPLTDVWVWSTRHPSGDSATNDVAVRKGRVYFHAYDRSVRMLVCADARSGTPLWTRPLTASLLPVRGLPAVSARGLVFVYDERMGLPVASEINVRLFARDPRPFAQDPSEVGGFVVRVFDSDFGRQVAEFPIETLQSQVELFQILLQHGPRASPGVPVLSGKPTVSINRLGTPLIHGEELYATNHENIYVRWKPGLPPYAARIGHATGSRPAEQFWGFPPTAAGNFILLAHDQLELPTNLDRIFPFFVAIDGDWSARWESHLSHVVGAPAAEGEHFYLGRGGPGAVKALACHVSATGEIVWQYGHAPPEPKPPLPVDFWVVRSFVVPDGPQPRAEGGLRDQLRQLNSSGFVVDKELITGSKGVFTSQIPPGHESNPGVVVTDRLAITQVGSAIVALDRLTGRLMWQHPLAPPTYVQSLAASRTHLFACTTAPTRLIARHRSSKDKLTREGRLRRMESIPYWDPGMRKQPTRNTLLAFRLSDGKLVKREDVGQPGSIALADGMVYLTNGDVTAYGPAERTYFVSSDTPDSAHYVKPPRIRNTPLDDPATGLPVAEEGTDAGPARDEDAPEPVPPAARADSSILRLSFATPRAQLLEQVRARLAVVQPIQAPLLVSLDWLDEKRAQVRGGAAGEWNAAAESRFVETCALLAREARPAYFDIAPEVNVYLRRYPDRGRQIGGLLARARQAVRNASADTRVLFSCNVEVFLDIYGKGSEHPFDRLPKSTAGELPLLRELLRLVDVGGITVRPQAGYRNPTPMPQDYLLRAVQTLGIPLPLVTRIVVEADAPGRIARVDQATYARRILQATYWLNSPWISQPDLIGYPETAVGDNAGGRDPIRQVAQRWQGVVAWPRVTRMTAKPPPAISDTLNPAIPRN